MAKLQAKDMAGTQDKRLMSPLENGHHDMELGGGAETLLTTFESLPGIHPFLLSTIKAAFQANSQTSLMTKEPAVLTSEEERAGGKGACGDLFGSLVTYD